MAGMMPVTQCLIIIAWPGPYGRHTKLAFLILPAKNGWKGPVTRDRFAFHILQLTRLRCSGSTRNGWRLELVQRRTNNEFYIGRNYFVYLTPLNLLSVRLFVRSFICPPKSPLSRRPFQPSAGARKKTPVGRGF